MHDGEDEDKEIDDDNKMRSDTGSSTEDSRIKDDNRSRIYEFIQKNPGSHLRKDTQYHLNILEKSGRIKSKRSTPT